MPRRKTAYIPYSPRVATFELSQQTLLQYRGYNILGLQESILAAARAQGIEPHMDGAKQFLSNVALAACQHFEEEDKRKADQAHHGKITGT